MKLGILQNVINKARFLCLASIDAVSKVIVDNQLVHRGQKFAPIRLARILCVLAARRLEPTSTTDFSKTVDTIVIGSVGAVPAMINHALASLPIGSLGKLNQQDYLVKILDRDFNIIYNWVTSGIFQSDLEALQTFAVRNSIVLVSIESVPFRAPSIALQITKDVTFEGTIPFELDPNAQEGYIKAAKQPDSDKLAEIQDGSVATFDNVEGFVENGIFYTFNMEYTGKRPLNLDEVFKADKAQYITASMDYRVQTASQSNPLMTIVFELVDNLSDNVSSSNLCLQIQAKSTFAPEDISENEQLIITATNNLYQYIYPQPANSAPNNQRGMANQPRVDVDIPAFGYQPRNVAEGHRGMAQGERRGYNPDADQMYNDRNSSRNRGSNSSDSQSNDYSRDDRNDRGLRRPNYSPGRGRGRGRDTRTHALHRRINSLYHEFRDIFSNF